MTRNLTVLFAFVAAAALGACTVIGDVDTFGDDPGDNNPGDNNPGDNNPGDNNPGDNDPGEEPQTVVSTLLAFGNCMTQADWDAAGLGELALVVADNGGTPTPCADCHSAGLGGAYLSADSIDTLEMTRASSTYVGKYISVDPVDFTITQANNFVEKGQLGGHPTYELDQALIDGLTAFYDATKERYDLDQCPRI